MKAKLIKPLEHRFTKNMRRHEGIDWNSVQAKLEVQPKNLELDRSPRNYTPSTCQNLELNPTLNP